MSNLEKPGFAVNWQSLFFNFKIIRLGSKTKFTRKRKLKYGFGYELPGGRAGDGFV